MKENLTKLLKVKTIITLLITFLFCYLSIKGVLPVDTITMVIGMVFTYYFNKDNVDKN
jgi:hypothetical protein